MASERLTLDSTELAEDAPASPLLRTRRGRFVLEGAPVDVIGVGPVALRADSEGDGTALVDRLAELSTARLRSQIRIETWAFCLLPESLGPWAAEGGGFDLGRFNERFWEGAATLAAYARDRGVLVELVLIDAAALKSGPQRTGWWRNPFNAACGGPIPSRSAARFFQMDEAVGPLDTLMDRALAAFDGMTNVTWELISSLDGSDPVRVAFVSRYVQRLRERDSLDRLVSVSLERPKRTDSGVYSLQGVDAAGFDWVDGGVGEMGFADTVEMLRRFGKPVVNHRARSASMGEEADERFRVVSALETGCSSIVRPSTVYPKTAGWLRDLVEHGVEGNRP